MDLLCCNPEGDHIWKYGQSHIAKWPVVIWGNGVLINPGSLTYNLIISAINAFKSILFL